MTGLPPLPSHAAQLACLADGARPIAARMRAIFYLRSGPAETRASAVSALCAALLERRGAGASVLFRHECAYVLGQMRDAAALPALLTVLRDASDDAIVRHEAGEALGAVAAAEALPALDAHAADPVREVAETCQVAAARVRWVLAGGEGGRGGENPFDSVDPAPAEPRPSDADVPRHAAALLDAALPLFERYKAMFCLRNNRSVAAVRVRLRAAAAVAAQLAASEAARLPILHLCPLTHPPTHATAQALCAGLTDASPLFRHEVAYVLGQLAHPASAKALMHSVADVAEHEMVRHEAAESLGAIGTPDCVAFLEAHAASDTPMLRESCVVALDCTDYWSEAGKEGLGSGGEGAPAAVPAQ